MEYNLPFFILVGLIAQLIDGALGMAYGIISTSMLLSMGIPPAAASASVHASKIITSGISGISHLGFGNVDRTLVKRLLIPGVLGGIIGAYILTSLPEEIIKPFVAAYLVVMGVVIFIKVTRKQEHREVTTHLVPLGLIGGFFDAIGGGGWGPIVTSNLIARGNNPRFSIGSVNAAEFFVALAQSVVFFLTIGLIHWQIILGLIIGGAVAAPMAAYVTRRLSSQYLMNIVGVVIIALSVRMILLTFK